jgi:hypothetical protein
MGEGEVKGEGGTSAISSWRPVASSRSSVERLSWGEAWGEEARPSGVPAAGCAARPLVGISSDAGEEVKRELWLGVGF